MELGWCGLEARRGWGIRQKKRWGQHRYHNRQIMIIINNPMILVIGNHSFFSCSKVLFLYKQVGIEGRVAKAFYKAFIKKVTIIRFLLYI